MPFSITGAPAWTLTPDGRKAVKARCAVIAIAFRPTTSRGRPGMCTSPAEIMVVTPPCKKLSIQPIWFCRGVQSPATGWTWLSIRAGDECRAVGVDDGGRAFGVDILGAADRGDPAVLGDDGVGIEDRLLHRPG